jgi:hypothetical protein
MLTASFLLWHFSFLRKVGGFWAACTLGLVSLAIGNFIDQGILKLL